MNKVMSDRISNKQTVWNLINIKARREQTSKHYVEAFRTLYEVDPLVSLQRGGKSASLKSVIFSETLDENNVPQWIHICLLSYTIVDSDAFYNKRSREDVILSDWNEDLVANKKEADLYFIPSTHTLAIQSSSKITLKNVVFYLSEALNQIEPETFDVDVIVERDILERISNAYAVTHLYANISYSNPGHSAGFEAAFDDKLRRMAANRIEIIASGSKENPLNNEEDGLFQAILNLSEQNGYVKATILPSENGKIEKIDSSAHPRRLVVPQIINDVRSTIYNAIRNLFH